ncbi:response regulator [Natranaerobius thermophilus]|uniref:Stage 0 sporulation protein A homolog n=1 Tax=Natranaerobius thermophilus (strain ATCC BAA-1301 / DSM 18059 / JW/NM-WN-LF) TaxID=457570 RepID=B2A8K6_NATTJ|nr:response regulator transcription factor [Natranaerobius thermophilus]ACB85890.1 two component transcriptional regulator, LuxR family [Natranaerobius thermophilus JW/NM-WN-LF]
MKTMDENKTIRILLADDHALFRQGLKKILDMEEDLAVCGEAQNGEEVVDKVKLLKPNIILMDINMPLLNGVEATKYVKEVSPETKVIALTIHEDEEYLFEIVKEGAAGFLLKDVETPTLVQAIQEVNKGNSFIHPTITHKLLGEFNRLAQNSPRNIKSDEAVQSELTGREKEILELMAQGYTNKEISKELYISEKTVKNHVSNILRKMDVTDRTQAVITALKCGVVQI